MSGSRKHTVFEGKQPKVTAEIKLPACPGRPAEPGVWFAKTDCFQGKTAQIQCRNNVSGLPGCRVGENRRFLKENSPRPPQKTCFRPTRAGQQDRVWGSRNQTVFEGKQPKTTAEIMLPAYPGRAAGPGVGFAKTDGFRRKTAQNNRRNHVPADAGRPAGPGLGLAKTDGFLMKTAQNNRRNHVSGRRGQASRTGTRDRENRRVFKGKQSKNNDNIKFRAYREKHGGLLETLWFA